MNMNDKINTYFYRVREIVFEGSDEPKEVTEDFKGPDLKECKTKAEVSYVDRLWHLTEPEEDQLTSSFIQDDLPYRRDGIFSVSLYFVICYSADNCTEYLMLDENDEEVQETATIEREVFNKLSFP